MCLVQRCFLMHLVLSSTQKALDGVTIANGQTILIYVCVHVCVHMFAFLEDFILISDLIPNLKKTLKTGLTYNDIIQQRCWI